MTHPFHPLSGRELSLVTYRHNWGENRAYYRDEQGRLAAIPAEWTSVAPADPFVMVSSGRSLFRFEDLLQLVDLVQRFGQRRSE